MTTSRYLGLYLEEARELFLEGNAALQARQLDAFMRVVHTLKGMSGTMGFKALADACHALEEEARAGKLPAANHTLWQNIGAALDRAQATQSDAALREFAVSAAAQPHTPTPQQPAMATWWRMTVAAEEPLPRARLLQWSAALRRAGVVQIRPSRSQLEQLPDPKHLDFLSHDPHIVDLARSLRHVAAVVALGNDPTATTVAATSPETTASLAVQPAAASILRVELRQLDELFAEIGEIHSQLRILNKLVYGSSDWERTMRNVQAAATRSVQRISSLRLSSLEPLLHDFERAATVAAAQVGKPVRIELSGAGIKVARETIERLRPLIPHIARNAVVHGIEAADVRRKRGKHPIGTIRLEAVARSNAVRLTISDDGGGVNTELLVQKARERGIALPDEDLLELLFLPGFSTKETSDDLAGRGVGLDAVREAVTSVGGTVRAKHTPGQGFALILDVPVPLSLRPILEVVPEAIPVGLIDEGWQRVPTAKGPWLRLAGVEPQGDIFLQGPTAALRVRSAQPLGYVYVHPLRPPFNRIPGAIGFYLDAGGVPRLILEPGIEAA